MEATISPDQQFIAFIDINGLHISKSPFTAPTSIIPTVGDAWSPVLSKDNHLAYSDHEGLKIYYLPTKAVTLLKSHFRSPFDETHDYYYVPVKWSPDGEWLWIIVGYWEGISQILTNVFTGVEQKYWGCNSDIDWSADSRAYVTTVFFTGYYLGCESGVYVGNVSRKDIIEEQVYSEGLLNNPSYASWDPTGGKIIFVQAGGEPNYRLLLLDDATKQVQELDNNEHGITSPKWSEDGANLYYIIHNDKDSSLIRLNLRTSKKNVIDHLAKDTEITAVVSKDDWLVARTYHRSNESDILLLINAVSGQQIRLMNIDPWVHNEPFLGIWEGQ